MTGPDGTNRLGGDPAGGGAEQLGRAGKGRMRRLAHVAVIVRSLAGAERLYSRGLGLATSGRETLAAEGVGVLFLAAGKAAIEAVQPLTQDSPLARFLGTRGETVHHVALEVDDVEAALTSAESAGLRLIDTVPRRGAHGTRVAFLHPKSTHGLLVELVERCVGGHRE